MHSTLRRCGLAFVYRPLSELAVVQMDSSEDERSECSWDDEDDYYDDPMEGFDPFEFFNFL